MGVSFNDDDEVEPLYTHGGARVSWDDKIALTCATGADTITKDMMKEREEDLNMRAGMVGKRTDRTWSVIHLLSYIWLAVVLIWLVFNNILRDMELNPEPNPLVPRNAVFYLFIIALGWYGVFALLSLLPFMHRRRTRYRRLIASLTLANIMFAATVTVAITKFHDNETNFPNSWWSSIVVVFCFIFALVSFAAFLGRRWYRLDAPGYHILMEDTAVSLYHGFMFYALMWVCWSDSVIVGYHQTGDSAKNTIFIMMTCLMFLYVLIMRIRT